MKKFLAVIVTLICCVCLLCACDPQTDDDGILGNSEAKVIGIKLSVNESIDYPLTPEDGVYVLTADKNYIVEIHMLRTGGSRPGYIMKSYIEFIYSEDVIELEDCNPDDVFEYYFTLKCLKTDVVTTIKVTGAGFSDEIKVKFVN
ncbi:MAG: hypothetical protein HDQ88_00060 [Clostridia bacterium]|nr:hypothetical protein [Clostridia bacterium]